MFAGSTFLFMGSPTTGLFSCSSSLFYTGASYFSLLFFGLEDPSLAFFFVFSGDFSVFFFDFLGGAASATSCFFSGSLVVFISAITSGFYYSYFYMGLGYYSCFSWVYCDSSYYYCFCCFSSFFLLISFSISVKPSSSSFWGFSHALF